MLGIVAAFGLTAAQLAEATAPTPGAMREARRWAAARFETATGAKAVEPPFSFTYDGKPSAELLKTWELKRTSRPLDAERTEHVLTFTDPKHGPRGSLRRHRVLRLSRRGMGDFLQE